MTPQWEFSVKLQWVIWKEPCLTCWGLRPFGTHVYSSRAQPESELSDAWCRLRPPLVLLLPVDGAVVAHDPDVLQNRLMLLVFMFGADNFLSYSLLLRIHESSKREKRNYAFVVIFWEITVRNSLKSNLNQSGSSKILLKSPNIISWSKRTKVFIVNKILNLLPNWERISKNENPSEVIITSGRWRHCAWPRKID